MYLFFSGWPIHKTNVIHIVAIKGWLICLAHKGWLICQPIAYFETGYITWDLKIFN